MQRPRVFMYHDGRHPHIYRYEAPMTKEEYVAMVDELAGTTVQAIAFCLGEGRTMLHDTKAGELMGHNIDVWDHAVFRRAAKNAKHLIDEGHDPLRLICDRAHEHGMQIYPTLVVQRGGVDHAAVRCSDFRRNNQHLEIGTGGGMEPDHPGYTGLDLKHPEARDERFAIVEEVVTDYEVDGFELQLNQMPYFFHPDEVDAGRGIMTDWIGRVYEVLKEGDSNRELLVHLPDRIEDCMSTGLDPEEWIKRGIVDGLIPEMFSENYYVKMEADFSEFVQMAESSNCRVIGTVNSMLMSDRLMDAPISMLRALACHRWGQSLSGLYLTEFFHHWPYEAQFYENIRELPFPSIMEAKDKYYFVPTNQNRTYTDRNPLPADLELDQPPVELTLTISDALHRWAEDGRVHEVLLRIRVLHNTETDVIEFSLNGVVLPDALRRKINQGYLMDGPRYRVMGGYWHIFKLDEAHWPLKGENRIGLQLRARDADLQQPYCTVADVELETKYLKGKNFHRSYLDPDLGPRDYKV